LRSRHQHDDPVAHINLCQLPLCICAVHQREHLGCGGHGGGEALHVLILMVLPHSPVV
jgi:hypothetical protein